MRVVLTDPGQLPVLFHHRWVVPVVAELAELDGAKFVTLVSRLGVSRAMLSATLGYACECGWVMRNPGYGHPLRPEWILTLAGAELAPAAARLWSGLRAHDVADVGLRKWSMPVMVSLRGEPARFGEIAGRVGRATDRALSQTLAALRSRALVEPSPHGDRTYRLLDSGCDLVERLAG